MNMNELMTFTYETDSEFFQNTQKKFPLMLDLEFGFILKSRFEYCSLHTFIEKFVKNDFDFVLSSIKNNDIEPFISVNCLGAMEQPYSSCFVDLFPNNDFYFIRKKFTEIFLDSVVFKKDGNEFHVSFSDKPVKNSYKFDILCLDKDSNDGLLLLYYYYFLFPNLFSQISTKEEFDTYIYIAKKAVASFYALIDLNREKLRNRVLNIYYEIGIRFHRFLVQNILIEINDNEKLHEDFNCGHSTVINTDVGTSYYFLNEIDVDTPEIGNRVEIDEINLDEEEDDEDSEDDDSDEDDEGGAYV